MHLFYYLYTYIFVFQTLIIVINLNIYKQCKLRNKLNVGITVYHYICCKTIHVQGEDGSGLWETTLVWPARPSQLRPLGGKGKG